MLSFLRNLYADCKMKLTDIFEDVDYWFVCHLESMVVLSFFTLNIILSVMMFKIMGVF